MSPLPAWLAGGHSVALNMCKVDLPLQLHYALFDGSGGYVLKPKEMRLAEAESTDASPLDAAAPRWPPPRDMLHRVTIELLSLHNLPNRAERRPQRRGKCHSYHPELSGTHTAPDSAEPSSPQVVVALYPIGGFCAVSSELPPPLRDVRTDFRTRTVSSNGLNARFDQTVHCLAAEPHETFLRISVLDGRQEVAYETATLGRLRRGYRVFRLRSELGTRIELCGLLVKISFGSERNQWSTTTDLRLRSTIIEHQLSERLAARERELAEKEEELAAYKELAGGLSRELAFSPSAAQPRSLGLVAAEDGSVRVRVRPCTWDDSV